MITEDPDIFLSDFGVSVVAGAVTSVGIFDMPGEVIMDNMIISTDYSLRVRASEFSTLGYGSAVVVDGGNYTVRESRLLDDGVFLQLSLQKTT
jgi:hypothetical protein